MWTADALASEIVAYRCDVWRVVESQYIAATMRVTDSLADQAILETLLDESKPQVPPECVGLDFLLSTPFRYWPYPTGSRFRRAGPSAGIFYAAEHVDTAIAETSFYRARFFDESPDTVLPSGPVEHTAFSVPCFTNRHIDLTVPQLNRDAALWTHPTDYAACQALADAARAASIEAIRYQSVRDPHRRANLAVLSPKAFAATAPTQRQTWHVFTRPQIVQAWCEAPMLALEFPRASLARL